MTAANQFPWVQPLTSAGSPAEPVTVAAIDCGTNSIRLLILRSGGGQVQELAREMVIVRLGEGVDETRRLSQSAIQRTVAAAENYADLCLKHGVSKLRFVATSASRDAENSDQFVTAIKNAIGLEPEVISGEEEAKLSFLGAIGALQEVTYPALVVDIGGGSTEFVVGSVDSQGEAQIHSAYSANMGSVRLTERFAEFRSDCAEVPAESFADLQAPTLEPVVKVQKLGLTPSGKIETAPKPSSPAAQWVDEYLAEVAKQVDFVNLGAFIGVAGTVTTVTAKALNLTDYEPEKIHNAHFTFAQQQSACEFMMRAPVSEKAALAYMPPGRADVIAAGALIWSRIMRKVAAQNPQLTQVTTSEQDILDGVALSLLR